MHSALLKISDFFVISKRVLPLPNGRMCFLETFSALNFFPNLGSATLSVKKMPVPPYKCPWEILSIFKITCFFSPQIINNIPYFICMLNSHNITQIF